MFFTKNISSEIKVPLFSGAGFVLEELNTYFKNFYNLKKIMNK